MSTPTEWIEAVERRIGCKLTQRVKANLTEYATEIAVGDVNDEFVDALVRGLNEGEMEGEEVCIPGTSSLEA